MGDPTQIEVWGQLDQVLATAWATESDKELKITQMAIDSGGHCTHEVYNYVRDRIRQGVVAIKGSSKRGSVAVSKGNKVDVNTKGRTLKRGVTLFSVGSDTIKTTLFGRMKHNDEGPGGLRFGLAADGEYFEQLTAEKQTLRYLRGFPIREWVKKPSARNEALDCAVYAYAALQLSYRKFNRATMWQQLQEQLDSGAKLPLRSRKPKPVATGTEFVRNW